MSKPIELVSLAVQVDGQAYFVNLPQDRLQLLAKMASGLADNGTLNLIKAPDGFAFINVKELGK